MVEPHAVFNNVVRTSSKACLAINKAMPEKQDDVEAHMYPTLPMETIKLAHNSYGHRIMHIETKVVQLETELMNMRQNQT